MRPWLPALLSLATACTSSGLSQDRNVLRPVPMRSLILVAPEVELAASAGTVVGKSALERRLWAELDAALTSGGYRADIRTGTDSLGAGPERTARIHDALAVSKVLVYREIVGQSAMRPHEHIAPDDVREIAHVSGADGVIVARIVGAESTASEYAADSAVSFVGKAAAGLLTLSPRRVARAVADVGNTSKASSIRIALIHGQSGEIVWANYAMLQRPLSPDIVAKLVELVVSDFPPIVPPGD